MIDNHTMTVIGSDLVAIEPYEATVISIGMGQRYDIVVTADQTDATDFWMRAIPQSACSENDNEDDIRGIIYYGDSPGTPTTSAYDYEDSCSDETDNIVPYVSKTVGSTASTTADEPVAVGFNSENLFKWTLNSTTFVSEWEDPTLMKIMAGETAFETSNAVVLLPNADEWVYVVISTTLAVPHPIHLHGHDFYVLAQGTGTYTDGTTTLNLDNPPRRDTAMLPASGYLVLAFETNNPGAWLMHCHIGWHTSEGFAMQFVEQYDSIAGITSNDTLTSNCESWTSHTEAVGIEQDDSGV
jgi:FtsP/CotA-like multicopper oxidase with cupredoxin domain